MIPKKPALGLDPRVDTGFRKRSCSTKSMIPKSGHRFSERIMLHEKKARAR
jgi:hypothetical protein